jgi:predicted dehydrogenase
VYCEWPLGNGLAEAEELAELARAQGVHAVVGLQARFNPAVQFVRRLIADGFVGRVRSTNMHGSGMAWGPATPASDAYVNDKGNGATLLSIPMGHSIDALCYVLGEFEGISAHIATELTEVTVLGTNEKIQKTAEDQVVLCGALAGGAAVSVHYRSQRSRATNFRWEINGTDGDLVLEGPSGHLQMMLPKVYGARAEDKELRELALPTEYLKPGAHLPGGPGLNVALAYDQLAEDMQTSSRLVPTFDHAVLRHRMLDKAMRAAVSEQRQR